MAWTMLGWSLVPLPRHVGFMKKGSYNKNKAKRLNFTKSYFAYNLWDLMRSVFSDFEHLHSDWIFGLTEANFEAIYLKIPEILSQKLEYMA